MNRKFYWQDWAATALGIWIVFSPLIIPFLFPASGGTSAFVAGNHFVVGVAVVVISWAAIATLQDWEEWVDVALGVWLASSPWVLGYTNATALTWNATIVGAMLVLVSIWSRYARPDLLGER